MLIRSMAVIALGALSATSTSAVQNSEAMYITHMYADASMTDEVGTITPECRYRPGGQGYYVQYKLHGTYTYYQVDEYVGDCPPVPE